MEMLRLLRQCKGSATDNMVRLNAWCKYINSVIAVGIICTA